jgi:hypothetical protein
MAKPLKEQFELFKQALTSKSFSKESPVFAKALEWIRKVETELPDQSLSELSALVCDSFNVSEEELFYELAGIKKGLTVQEGEVPTPQEAENFLLDFFSKSDSIFHKHILYTEESEAPLLFHVFCLFLCIGAVLRRNVFFEMGYFRYYPCLSIILIGPSGRVKKTSCGDIVLKYLYELGCTKIYAEKITPEALAAVMEEDARGLIYAPEMSNSFGKQKYMTGAVTLLTRLLDQPDILPISTLGRGEQTLHNVGISALFGTTPDWLVNNTSEETFGGGFFGRQIICFQNDSARVKPHPKPISSRRVDVLIALNELLQFKGEMTKSPELSGVYNKWYNENKALCRNPPHELLAQYYDRKGGHVIRLAMILHLAEHKNRVLCVECFEKAVRLLGFTELFLPQMLQVMFRTESGLETEYVLNMLRSNGGVLLHSDFVRKVQYRMDASKLKKLLESLKEGRQVEERSGKLGHIWMLKGAS